MLFSTKSPLLLILLTLIFTTITHAAPAADDVDPDEDMISICLSIPECLKSIEEEKKKLDEKNVAALNKAERIQAYKPIFQQIGSLTELYSKGEGKGGIVRGRVRKWIRWQKDVDEELYGDVEMVEEDDMEMVDEDVEEEDVRMGG